MMSEGSAQKWCIMFNGGQTNVHDEERSFLNKKHKTRIEEKSKKKG